MGGGLALLVSPELRWMLDASRLATWVAAQGPWAPLVYVAVSMLGAMMWVPRTPLGMAAGVLFGPWRGAGWALLGAVAGASVNYAYARLLLRGEDEQALTDRLPRRLRPLARIADRHAFGLVALGHLSPVGDFQVINYLAGAGGMRLRSFLLATLLGMVPGSAVQALLGSAVALGNSAHTAVSLASLLVFLLGSTFILLRWSREDEDHGEG